MDGCKESWMDGYAFHELTKKQEQITQEKEEIEVATICKGNKTSLLTNLAHMVNSMLEKSGGSKIRLTVLSDPQSWPFVHQILRQTIGHYYSKGKESAGKI